jgi:integrase
VSKALSDTEIRKAKTKPRQAQRDLFDTQCTGLVIRITSNGTKTWYLIYISPRDGKRARLKLGRYPELSLHDARDKALAMRKLIEAKKDPRDVPDEPPPPPPAANKKTMREMSVDRLNDLALDGKPLRDPDQVHYRFNTYIAPHTNDGALPVDGFTLDHHDAIINPLKARGVRDTARKVFNDLVCIFDHSISKRAITVSPIAGLSAPSIKRPKGEKPKKDPKRFLDVPEIPQMWHGVEREFGDNLHIASLLRFQLLTGTRFSESAGMKWDELLDLDGENPLVIYPWLRVKNSKDHMLPLSRQAGAIVRSQRERHGNKVYVFPNTKGQPLHKAVVGAALRRALAPTKELPLGRLDMLPWSTHTLRKTFTTYALLSKGMGGLGYSRFLVGKVLNHTMLQRADENFGAPVTEIYDGNTYLHEKREILQAWADWLDDVLRDDKVVPLIRAA